jgi:hypothetical protein
MHDGRWVGAGAGTGANQAKACGQGAGGHVASKGVAVGLASNEGQESWLFDCLTYRLWLKAEANSVL